MRVIRYRRGTMVCTRTSVAKASLVGNAQGLEAALFVDQQAHLDRLALDPALAEFCVLKSRAAAAEAQPVAEPNRKC